MRKFKLIKEYIGSPKLGTISKYTGDLFDKDNDLLPSVVKDKHFFDFWEEITLESSLDIIQNIKKPLFTTEDGVDVYEDKNGEFSYWTLYTDAHSLVSKHWTINSAPNFCKHLNPTSAEEFSKYGFKRFSTKEAAEYYILMNKPCLSLHQIQSIMMLNRDGSYFKRLKELVKSKL